MTSTSRISSFLLCSLFFLSFGNSLKAQTPWDFPMVETPPGENSITNFTVGNISFPIYIPGPPCTVTSGSIYTTIYPPNGQPIGRKIFTVPEGVDIKGVWPKLTLFGPDKFYVLTSDNHMRILTIAPDATGEATVTNQTDLGTGTETGSNLAPLSYPVGDDTYITTTSGTVYVTHNDTIWHIDTTGLGGTASTLGIDSSQNIYAACSKGVFKQGRTSNQWNLLPGSPASQRFLFTSKKEVIYSGDNSFIWRTTDRGVTWALDTAGMHGTVEVMSMAEDHLGNIYAVTQYSDHVWKQSPGGMWQEIDNGLTGLAENTYTHYLHAISVDSGIHVASAFGEFDSYDGGKTWQPLTNGFHADAVYSFYQYGNGNNVMTTNLGLFTQKKGETTWTKRFPQNTYLAQIHFFVDNSGHLYALGNAINSGYGKPYGIYVSTDQGVTWTADITGLSQLNNGTQYVDENGNEYLATYDTPHMRVFVKNPGGSWHGDSTGYSPKSGDGPSAYASDYHGNIYLAINNYTLGNRLLKRSVNGGTWSEVTLNSSIGLPYSFTATRDGKLVGGNTNTSVGYYDGSSWTVIPNPPGLNNPSGYPQSVDSSNGLYVIYGNVDANYYYTAYGVYYTKDLGKTWKKVADGAVTLNSIVSFKDSTYGISNYGVYNLTASSKQSVAVEISGDIPLAYPNPIHRGERLHLSSAGATNPVLFDLLGRKIASLGNEFLIPTDITPGIYFIEASGKRFKIVVAE